MSYLITDFLEEFKNYLESFDNLDKDKYLKSTSSYNGFEKLISDNIEINRGIFLSKECSQHDVRVKPNFGHHFPDLDVFIDGEKYGVELKSRKDGSWVNNGGSVFESQTSQDYKEIYIFFGTYNEKLGDTAYKIKFRPHWEVAENIAVTHSPRYFYNMNAVSSLFTSSEQYLELRKSREKVEIFIQKVLRNLASGPKWYLSVEDEQINPILITTLSDDLQIKVYAEISVLYPQDLFSSSRNKFIRAASFMMNSYFYYSSSLRDSFSAGGKWTPAFYPDKYKKTNKVFPHVIQNLQKWNKEIEYVCQNQSEDFKNEAYKSWESLDITLKKQDFLTDYKKVIDYLGYKYYKAEILKSGIKDLTLSQIIF